MESTTFLGKDLRKHTKQCVLGLEVMLHGNYRASPLEGLRLFTSLFRFSVILDFLMLVFVSEECAK